MMTDNNWITIRNDDLFIILFKRNKNLISLLTSTEKGIVELIVSILRLPIVCIKIEIVSDYWHFSDCSIGIFYIFMEIWYLKTFTRATGLQWNKSFPREATAIQSSFPYQLHVTYIFISRITNI